MKNKKGFTLIELLVVVLIIGILASISFPQYRKSVEKARLSEALETIKSIEDATHRLLHEKDNVEDITFDMLDIELPNASGDTYTTENFEYGFLGDGTWDSFTSVYAMRTNELYELIKYIDAPSSPTPVNLGFCYTHDTDIGRYICETLRSQGWSTCESTLECSPQGD